MPINDFDGNTYVAFIDISGFKELMKTEKKAWVALDNLYNYGYKSIQEYKEIIAGIFISDCGVLFIQDKVNELDSFRKLLEVIKKINKKMLKKDFMLTTSIAYGKFKYQQRIEFEGINKNPIYGDAYVSAYFDCEMEKPSIEPGQCRIVVKNLPEEVLIKIQEQTHIGNIDDKIFSLITERENDRKHFYFYWMIDNYMKIDTFEKHYQNSYKLKYDGFMNALKGNNLYSQE